MLVVLLSACVTSSRPHHARPISAAVRVDAALLAMADARRADLPVLDRVLQSVPHDAADRARHRRAVLLIGQLRVRERYAYVRTLVSNPDTALSATAVFALGLARDTASLDVLARAIDGRADGTAAAYGLTRSRAVGAARALLAQAEHQDAAVRAQVAAGMSLTMVGDSLLAQALRLVPPLRRDPGMQVRVQAVRSASAMLARWDSSGVWPSASRSVRAAMPEALRDRMAAVRVTAAEGMAPVLGNDDVAWQQAFGADTTFMVQRTLLEAAVRRGRLAAARSLWEQHADPWRRVAAFGFANRASSGDPMASATVLERSRWARVDPAARVRAAAVTFLGSAVDQPAVRSVLIAMQADPDPLVQASAVGAMVSRATARDARRAIGSYRADSTRDGHAVRSAALRVIASAWRRDSADVDADLRAQRGMLPVAADPLVRRGVRDVTPMALWAAVDGPVVANADYTRVAAEWLGGAPRVTARLHTQRGVITLALLPTDAPLTVDNFVQLARRQYFNGTRFHRVIAGFVAQDGDPTGTGSGQYFFTLTPQPHLDGGDTVFAQVTHGFDVMDALLLGDRILRVEVP